MKMKEDDVLPSGETFKKFRRRNLKWWKSNEKRVRKQSPELSRQFFDYIDQEVGLDETRFNENIVLGEVCGGALGGVLESLDLTAKKKVQIDILADDFQDLGFVNWSDNTEFIGCPAEGIDLPDDYVDILFGYNSIDHGWDVIVALDECIRISRECYLMFDCKGGSSKYKKSGNGFRDHYQEIFYNDVKDHVESLRGKYSMVEIRNNPTSYWPKAYVFIRK